MRAARASEQTVQQVANDSGRLDFSLALRGVWDLSPG
jgi:hypothetical protein